MNINQAPEAGDQAAAAQSVRAIACMLVGVALLSLNDGLVKSLTSDYSPGQLLFTRGLFIYPWIVLFALRDGGLHRLRVKSLKGQMLRGFCVIASAFCFVNGLFYLPLADAIAVAFTGPLFITALAPSVLGEQVGWRRWAAVLIGFAGVLFIVQPDGDGVMQWAVLFPMAAALFGGVRDLITRRISQTENTIAVLFVTTTCVMLAGLCTAPFGWTQLDTSDLWTFAASGGLVAGAHYLMIEAFRQGEAAMVAPFKYTSIIWGVLFGFIIFGDIPGLSTLFGAGMVILAGLYILQRETQLRKKPVTAVGPSARI